MNTDPISPQALSSSVIAVPPLARSADLSVNATENKALIQHLEAGGVSTLLYGGNAVLYHVAVSEYAELLTMLAEAVTAQTLVIPSVGPGFGTMMDQATVLREFEFPTAMILPTRDVCTSDGVASAIRRFAEAAERPAVLYIKHDGFIRVDEVKRLMDDELLSWIKYAIVRDNPSDDDYLRQLVETIGPSRIVSGIGEQPAITHWQQFKLAGFTSGCVCVAPRRSMEMLRALKSGDLETAEQIREKFRPLEDLRNAINPIRVLHRAVALAGIAKTGPMLPLLGELAEHEVPAIRDAALNLLALDQYAATS